MTGYEQFMKLLGDLPVALIIEVIFAGVFVLIAYKRLKASIIKEHTEKEQEKEDIECALKSSETIPELQKKLQDSEDKILAVCTQIQDGVKATQESFEKRLDRLEHREKNDLRNKILDRYRLFTDEHRNPMLAWSEMERDAFFEQIADYESLNGNGHIHTVVIPAMQKLRVIYMTDIDALEELYKSRKK